jgi:hypothetical protein
MPFGNHDQKPKGNMPFFTGTIQEYEGKTKVSLWPTDEFKEFMRKIAKGEE